MSFLLVKGLVCIQTLPQTVAKMWHVTHFVTPQLLQTLTQR